MKRQIILLLVALLGCSAIVTAQSRKGALFINEVMVQNDSNFVDDFGKRSAWIELYNAQFAPLEISSIYITNDSTNTTLYAVPLGDVNTHMPKRQHVVFWADGMPSRGTFHTSFTLEPGKDNWIGIYDSDKLTLLDSVTIPASLGSNQSYARVKDGKPEAGWEVRTDRGDKYITPSSNNVIRDSNDKIDMFAARDENGFAMTIMAMCIVFTALLVLSLCFKFIGSLNSRKAVRLKAIAQGIEPSTVDRHAPGSQDSGEEIAAIVMALHEHLNSHDTESTVLTINKVKRAYSPWSSKIYNLREIPRR